MELYRIATSRYAEDLSGVGAGLFGGRWNPVGTNAVYTAGSISLACLEYLVHNFHVLSSKSIALIKIKVESHAILELSTDQLPFDWNEKTYMPQTNQSIGLRFLQALDAYMMKVPSAIVASEYNYILNPRHAHHSATRIKQVVDPFTIDDRLML